MDSSTGGSQPATKEMRCYVAELNSDGKVVMVEKAIGEAAQGGLDDYRAQSKDNRINPGNGNGREVPTTVLASASAGDVETLRRFLESGGDPNQAMSRTGTTALMLAAHKGHADCVRCLLAHRADPAKQDDADGLTALMLACSVAGRGQTAAVELLLAAPGSLAAEGEGEGVVALTPTPTPTGAAAAAAAATSAALGLQKDCDGRTPLLYACRRGHKEAALMVLTSEPATVNLCDESGTSPVMAAAANGHTATLKLLLAGNGNPLLSDEMGCTPLHLAVVQSHPAAIAVLLAAGASPDAEDDDGYTPASEAAEIGDPDVLAALGLPLLAT